MSSVARSPSRPPLASMVFRSTLITASVVTVPRSLNVTVPVRPATEQLQELTAVRSAAPVGVNHDA